MLSFFAILMHYISSVFIAIKIKNINIIRYSFGNSFCRAEEVLDFLNKCEFEKLILNGDIIDGWSLKKEKADGYHNIVKF